MLDISSSDPEFIRALNVLEPQIGPAAALDFALMGLPTAWAVKLYAAPAGQRLLKHDPAAKVGDAQVAGVLGISVSEFAQMVGRNFPGPDEKKGEFRLWNLSTVGRWLGRGCPDQHGRPNHWVADRVGAKAAN